jgi:uncharacterized membrane protein/3-hydroxymyristoyl/3-hydroxydecanoyl-(acyl carrier protein) dehydratase
MRPPSPVRRVLAVTLAVAYPVVAHAASSLGSRALTLASVAVLGAATLGPPLLDRRPWAFIALPLAAAAIAALARLDAVALVLFVPPVLLNAWLAWLFGHTLARGRVPLIERLVRLLQPPGQPFEAGVIAYARTLTRLWVLLFVVLGAVSLALALFATPRGLLESAGIAPPFAVRLETWSLFANVVNYLFVAAVFLVEFAYRRRRFPGRPYRNLFDFFRRAAAVAPALAAGVGRRRGEAPGEAVEEVFEVPADHPAFAGHFPGRPVLPAVALLDLVFEAAARQFGAPASVSALPRAKFTAPLAPGDRGRIRLTLRDRRVEFEVRRGEERVAEGVFEFRGAGAAGDG